MSTELLDRDAGSRSWTLRIEEQSTSPFEVAVSPGASIVLGRSRDCDIRVSDPRVSGHQAVFSVSTDATLDVRRDERANQDIRVNDVSLPKGDERILVAGDVIAVGNTRILVACSLSAHLESGSAVHDGYKSREDDSRSSGETQETHLAWSARHTETLEATNATVFGEPESGETQFIAPVTGNVTNEENQTPTGFLPEDSARRVISTAQRKTKRSAAIMWLSLCAAIVLFLTNVNQNNSAEQGSFLIESDRFSLVVPSRSVRTEPLGKFVSITYPGAMVLVYPKEDGCRWWTYDRALSYIREAVSSIAGSNPMDFRFTLEMATDYDGTNPVVRTHRAFDHEVPFVRLHGTSLSTNNQVAGRIYLAGESMTSVLVLRSDTRESPAAVLETFTLKKMENDWIDRRRTEGVAAGTTADQLIEEAAYWYSNRDVAPGNLWKAYNSFRQYMALVSDTASLPPLSDNNWVKFLGVASELQTRYSSLRNIALRAYISKEIDLIDLYTARIQELIPDTNDYRWMWAKRQRDRFIQERRGTPTSSLF